MRLSCYSTPKTLFREKLFLEHPLFQKVFGFLLLNQGVIRGPSRGSRPARRTDRPTQREGYTSPVELKVIRCTPCPSSCPGRSVKVRPEGRQKLMQVACHVSGYGRSMGYELKSFNIHQEKLMYPTYLHHKFLIRKANPKKSRVSRICPDQVPYNILI